MNLRSFPAFASVLCLIGFTAAPSLSFAEEVVIEEIVVDPDDWRIAYAMSSARIAVTTDGGQHWFDGLINTAVQENNTGILKQTKRPFRNNQRTNNTYDRV